MSQKTYLGALEGLYLQDTGKNQNCFIIIVFYDYGHQVGLP